MHKTRVEHSHKIASAEGRCPGQVVSMVTQVPEEPDVQTLCPCSDTGNHMTDSAKSKGKCCDPSGIVN